MTPCTTEPAPFQPGPPSPLITPLPDLVFLRLIQTCPGNCASCCLAAEALSLLGLASRPFACLGPWKSTPQPPWGLRPSPLHLVSKDLRAYLGPQCRLPAFSALLLEQAQVWVWERPWRLSGPLPSPRSGDLYPLLHKRLRGSTNCVASIGVGNLQSPGCLLPPVTTGWPTMPPSLDLCQRPFTLLGRGGGVGELGTS